MYVLWKRISLGISYQCNRVYGRKKKSIYLGYLVGVGTLVSMLVQVVVVIWMGTIYNNTHLFTYIIIPIVYYKKVASTNTITHPVHLLLRNVLSDI